MFKTATDGLYASEETTETIATGDGSTTEFTGTFGLTPMRPKRLEIRVDNALVATDNGNGIIAGSGVSGTVKYSGDGAGDYTVKFDTAPGSNVSISAYYSFDTEQEPDHIREIELGLRIIPVLAKEHPLKVSWSMPAQFAASASIGLDVEDTLSVLAGQFIKTERDRYIINFISKAAGAPDPDLAFDCTVQAGEMTKRDHYKDFKISIDKAGNKIIKNAGRGALSWIVAGNNVATVIKNCDGFIPEADVTPIGAHVIGTLDSVIIIKDPNAYDANIWLGGYNGILPGDAGVILAELQNLESIEVCLN